MIKIFSDGGSRGNPGQAASAFVVYENEKLIHSDAKYLGITTNNVAEYNGVIIALEWAITTNEKEIIFCMDSELVVKQLSGIYKIKNTDLLQLSQRIKNIIKENNLEIKFVHVPRAENAFADKLVNEKLDDSSRL
ncbi:hypothetical protein BH10PAT1_BH10PAT1_7560 [soil metagenome]